MAVVAGIFAVVVSLLTIVNYVQIKRADPINTETINLLVERLNQNPQDIALRNQIRELDLLVRKAYFTSQWQIRTGAYILLISLALLIISLQVIAGQKKPDPKPGDEESESFLAIQKNTRRWIAGGGGLLVVLALIMTFLTHNELQYTFDLAAKGEQPSKEDITTQTATEEVVIQPIEVIEEVVHEEAKEVVTDKPMKQEPLENIQAKAEIVEKETQPSEQPKAKPIEKAVAKTEKVVTTEDKAKRNFVAFRGHGGNGVVFQDQVPMHWNGLENEHINWKVEMPLDGYNSPIIWEDKLFLSGADENRQEVYCFNRLNGELLWTALVDQIPGSPEKAPDVTPDTGHAAPTLTTDGSFVYAIFSTGDVIALNMDGERQWARNLGVPSNHYGHSSSLLVYQNKLLIQYDHSKEAKVMALDTQNGETLWSTPRKVKVSWASPVLVNTGSRMELILTADPLVVSYDPETGAELWQLKCMMGEVGPSVVYADGVVFAMNEYASLVAIKSGSTPEILWEDDEYLSDVPSPVATDKYLFIATSYGVVVCYDSKTGEKYWEQEYDDGFYSSMMMHNDLIYLIDKRGITHIFKADKIFEEVATSPLGEAVYTSPAFAEGNLYIRAEKNLYSIGM